MSETEKRPAALVTGGAIRLGKAIAVALAKHGYDIALHYNRSESAAAETAEEIRALGVNCTPFQQNLLAAEELKDFVPQVQKAFPRLAVLVNSASGYESGTIAETSVETFDTQFALNLRAPFFLMQAFAQHVTSGSVINIIDNKIGFNQFDYAAYLLAKKALVDLTKMASLEFAPALRVNGVAPGVVLPAVSRSEEYIAWRVQGIPLQIQGDTTHITQAITSLLGNAFITGQIIVVDGGESLTNIGRNATQFDPDKV